jgi:alpha-pyrone synthase
VTCPRITQIATAAPEHDIHLAFIRWAEARISDERQRTLFRRMADRSGIRHRYAVLQQTREGGSPVDPGGFYAELPLPTTSERMDVYGSTAPELALQAIAKLNVNGVTHLVVASCTGFVAPGIDQIIAARLGLAPTVERLLIGFMGCYAAVTALGTARHIVRSEPAAKVLVVTVELSSLHLNETDEIEPLLAMLQFGDGAAAAIVEARGEGLGITRRFALALPDSEELIGWKISDHGFVMHLSGEVPGRIAHALGEDSVRKQIIGPNAPEQFAVHAGGRSILDAVEHGLCLPKAALSASRDVLADYGNMSSSTLMFVLAQQFGTQPKSGVAMAFGPGLAVEGFDFGWVG